MLQSALDTSLSSMLVAQSLKQVVCAASEAVAARPDSICCKELEYCRAGSAHSASARVQQTVVKLHLISES